MSIILLQAWDKEKKISPQEELNFRPLDSTLWCSTNEAQRLHGKDHYEVHIYDKHPAYC